MRPFPCGEARHSGRSPITPLGGVVHARVRALVLSTLMASRIRHHSSAQAAVRFPAVQVDSTRMGLGPLGAGRCGFGTVVACHSPQAPRHSSVTRRTSASTAAPRPCTATTSAFPRRGRAAPWTASCRIRCCRGAQAEHEGRGYVQSDDVVNAGFIQGEESFVRVQVVYDEPLPLDDYEGVDITRLTPGASSEEPLRA